MPRAVWKGAISFGLVHVPVALYPASEESEIDFDWLKVYALLREAMSASSLIGIARLVIHTKEHLAAVLPAGPALMLGTLRWASEVRSAKGLKLPPEGKAGSKFKEAELKMAAQLIKQMTRSFDPRKFEDRFSGAIHRLVARKVKAGESKTVEPLEEMPAQGESNVIDLTELLRNSLRKKAGGRGSAMR